MTHVDDLNIDDWVVIAECHEDAQLEWQEPQQIGWLMSRPSKPQLVDGTPYQVKAFGLPFLAVLSICGQVKTIDVRNFRLQRVPVEYVQALQKHAEKKIQVPGVAGHGWYFMGCDPGEQTKNDE